jgi:hypothetical protein
MPDRQLTFAFNVAYQNIRLQREANKKKHTKKRSIKSAYSTGYFILKNNETNTQ